LGFFVLIALHSVVYRDHNRLIHLACVTVAITLDALNRNASNTRPIRRPTLIMNRLHLGFFKQLPVIRSHERE